MHQYKYFSYWVGIYVASVIIFNVCALKLWQFGDFVFTAGIILVPISYIFGDILTEVYGYARARQVIWLGFFCNVFYVLAIQITIWLPAADGWNLQPQLESLFSSTPRIVVGSLLGYLTGEFTNSYVLAALKISDRDTHLFRRVILSTVAGQFVDTLVFVIIAFGATVTATSLLKVICSAYLFKIVFEILAFPLTRRLITRLKHAEGADYFDYSTSLSPLGFISPSTSRSKSY